MKHRPPAALVQIHYHDRLGGVRQVMEDYGSAFSAFAGVAAPNYRWCQRSGSGHTGDSIVVDLPGADYHRFITKRAFQREAGRLTRFLVRQLGRLSECGPVAVVGHNLALGKNPALSEAFARCARLFGGDTGVFRFFSVIHDVAEQGRYGLLSHLEQLKSRGVDIYASLYAKGSPVHFIAPDRRARQTTGLSDEYLTILPNRVDKKTDRLLSLHSEQVRRLLEGLARQDGLFFNTEIPLYFYPSRMLYRKNIMEALLLATVMHNGSLLTGPSGTATADRHRMEAALYLARRYRLSLAVDPERIRAFTRSGGKVSGDANPFHSIYRFADFVISTSIAEGFGYSFYEPWLYGVPVGGRKPEGIALPPCMNALPLYSRLPVPCSWVQVDDCYNRYASTINRTCPGRHLSKRAFQNTFIRDGTVDFGRLDTAMQSSVIERVMGSDTAKSELSVLLKSHRLGFPAPGEWYLRPRETERITHGIASWSGEAFIDAFVKLLSRQPVAPDHPTWYRHIADWYQNPENIHITVPVAGVEKPLKVEKLS